LSGSPLSSTHRTIAVIVLGIATLTAVGIALVSLFALFLGGWVEGVPLIIAMGAVSIALPAISAVITKTGSRRSALIGLVICTLPFGVVAYVKIHNWRVHKDWKAAGKVAMSTNIEIRTRLGNA
jgi:hypothetical protein